MRYRLPGRICSNGINRPQAVTQAGTMLCTPQPGQRQLLGYQTGLEPGTGVQRTPCEAPWARSMPCRNVITSAPSTIAP